MHRDAIERSRSITARVHGWPIGGFRLKLISTPPDLSMPRTRRTKRTKKPRTVRRPPSWAVFALAVLGALSPTAHASATVTTADTAPCPQILGLDMTSLKNATLVGELHGTNESPAFVAALSCNILTRGHSLKVALEIPASEQERIRTYLASEGTEKDRKAMLAGAFWATDMADGRSSVAMANLIERLRYLRSVKLPLLDVVTIDLAAGDASPTEDRDRRMSEAFAAIIKTDGSHHVVGLVGNYHAKKTDGAPWNPRKRFMAGYLPAGSVSSFDVGYTGGSAWICVPDCGVSEVSASSQQASPGFAIRVESKDGGAYDGIYDVGRLTPSVPARADSR